MKKLGELIAGGGDVEVGGIETDSRKELKGKVFVAYKGVNVDGHKFIEQAIEKGAVAVVGEEDIKDLAVPYVQVPNGRLAWAQLWSAWYGHPEDKLKIIGVTGTDGKTTTSTLIYEMLKAGGFKVALVSTVAAYIGDQEYDTGFHVTSPDPDQLWKLLDTIVKNGCEYLVLEVTSHGLEMERFGEIKFEIGVLTNITHEHLDYHKTFENYRDSKLKLFLRSKISVLNKDDPSFEWLKSQIPNPKSQGIIQYSKYKFQVKNPVLLGDYNLYNIGAAAAVAKLLKVQENKIQRIVAEFKGIPGRREEVKLGQKFRIIIDFAHTPNAQEQIMGQLKKEIQSGGKLIAVFGCAGLRDATKRPIMGKVSTTLADKVIVTAEDPRTESLDSIYQQIMQGVAEGQRFKVAKVDDRQKAIDKAVQMAGQDDIVVVMGKAHEKSMCFGTTEYPWSDKEAVKKAVAMYT